MKSLPFNLDLGEKVVVITGAGGILCSGFAKTVAACNAKVALLDLNYDAAKAVADEIIADGGKALAVETNVLKKESVQNAKEIIDKELGTCDILINGAGGNNPKGSTSKDFLEESDLENNADITGIKTFFDLDAEGVSFVFNLNFLGTLIPTQVFAKDMAKKEGCSIINVSSMNAFRPLTRIPAYSGAKAAISNFTQWLAVHFAKVGIRVNAIAPGFFLTNQNKALLINPDGSLSERSKKIINQTPMGKFGQPEDLDGALQFLLNEKASGFVNGVVIPVDGGFSAYSGV